MSETEIAIVAARLTTVAIAASKLRHRGVDVPASAWAELRSAMTKFSMLVLDMMPAREADDLDIHKAARDLLHVINRQHLVKAGIGDISYPDGHCVLHSADRLRKALNHAEGIAP